MSNRPDATASETVQDQPVTAIWTRMWRHARPYLHIYACGFLLLLLTNALALGIPWVLRNAIGAMEEGADLRRVSVYAAAMAALALAQAVARTGSRLTILGASRRIACDIRDRFFEQLQRLGASFYDRQRTGDLLSRGVNDLRLLRVLYGFGMMNLCNTVVIFVAVLFLLFRIDGYLALVSLALLPLLLLAVNRISRRVYGRSMAVQEQLADLSSRAQENLSGIQQVKTFVQEDREISRFEEQCAEFRRRSLSLTVMRGWMTSLVGIVAGVGTLLVLYLGGRHVVEGRITFADFVAFNAYLAMLTWPTVAMGWIINVFQRGVGAMRRVEEILLQVPDIPPAADEETDGAEPVDGDIEFRNLSFAYTGDDGEPLRPSLREIDLKIPRGSRVALVGPVGSGKSTMADLLARVYPAPRGALFLGGEDINDIPVSRLRRSIGYVPQEAFLFSRSIRENITLGRPEVSEERVAIAVGLSRLEGEIEALPEGLDTVVGERGVTLSGGQRQRATLARAALGDPRILILDDALSSVDADTERAILDQLRRLMEGRTSIVITHRLSSLSGIDRIVVLEDGRVLEDGSHRELLAAGGKYARLFRRQELERRLEGQ